MHAVTERRSSSSSSVSIPNFLPNLRKNLAEDSNRVCCALSQTCQDFTIKSVTFLVCTALVGAGIALCVLGVVPYVLGSALIVLGCCFFLVNLCEYIDCCKQCYADWEDDCIKESIRKIAATIACTENTLHFEIEREYCEEQPETDKKTAERMQKSRQKWQRQLGNALGTLFKQKADLAANLART